jgi:hypothetical protein
MIALQAKSTERARFITTSRDHQTNAGPQSSPIDLDAGRRAFLRSAGLTAAGAAIFAGSAGLSTEALAGRGDPALSDPDILNFALNLEYLEAEFYLRATTGNGLDPGDTTGTGKHGGVTPPKTKMVNFASQDIKEYAQEIAADEKAHVLFLRAALGSAKVARPTIDLRNSFTAAAQAAGLIKAGQTFDPFASENNFLIAAFIFEDVGVTAYKGAARFINNPDYLEAAAGILAVEAYHASEIRTILFSRHLKVQANSISRARDSLDGKSNDDQGIVMTGNDANIVPSDKNGIAFSRTPRQVLNIVYLNPSDMNHKGGFFPNGTNGTLN